jgi:hypothetical protein
MRTPWTTRIAIGLTLLGMACASAPAPVPAPMPSKPQGVSSSSAAATVTGPATAQLTLPEVKKPLAVPMAPVKIETKLSLGSYDRVALIWGYPGCLVRPWVVTVVDLGTRTVTWRALAASTELDLYFPSPTGEGCYKGPCPTMAVELPPQSPGLFSGSGTMPGGMGKGLYALASGTSCPEPPVMADGDLYDFALRLVTARNEAQAAISARVAASGGR